MADKERIIIDGVDVSKCDFLLREDDYCSYSGEYRAYKGQCGCPDEEMCKDHPNCFYKKVLKQLKRKEQECEELNDDNRYFVKQIISLETLTDKYERAFNEIEKNIKGYCKNMCMAETKETCDGCQNIEILDIINEVKGQ